MRFSHTELQLDKSRALTENARELDESSIGILETGMALADAGAMARNENGIATVVSILKKRFGDNAQTGKSIREQHGHTTSYVPNQAPDLVVFAETTEDVQEVVRLCSEWQVPVIPFGPARSG